MRLIHDVAPASSIDRSLVLVDLRVVVAWLGIGLGAEGRFGLPTGHEGDGRRVALGPVVMALHAGTAVHRHECNGCDRAVAGLLSWAIAVLAETAMANEVMANARVRMEVTPSSK
jgi:hypothetical protein